MRPSLAWRDDVNGNVKSFQDCTKVIRGNHYSACNCNNRQVHRSKAQQTEEIYSQLINFIFRKICKVNLGVEIYLVLWGDISEFITEIYTK